MSAILAALFLAVTPQFVTPEMMYRRGLTDEQYEYLWKQGKNPQIEPAAARQWIFKSARYQNVTNWLNIVGQTNNFARLSFTLQAENERLDSLNESITALNRQLQAEATLWMERSEAFSNAVVVAQGRLQAATAKITAEVDSLKEEKTDLQAKIADSKYILLRPWLKTKLATVEARIAILESLAGSN